MEQGGSEKASGAHACPAHLGGTFTENDAETGLEVGAALDSAGVGVTADDAEPAMAGDVVGEPEALAPCEEDLDLEGVLEAVLDLLVVREKEMVLEGVRLLLLEAAAPAPPTVRAFASGSSVWGSVYWARRMRGFKACPPSGSTLSRDDAEGPPAARAE